MIYREPDGTFRWDSDHEAIMDACTQLCESLAEAGATDFEIDKGICELLMAMRLRQLN